MEARVLLLEFDLSVESPAPFLRVLDALEIERAGRFRAREDRVRFVQTRAWLRMLAARLIRREPAEVEFKAGPHGKLSCPDTPWYFNVSHSGAFGALAFTRVGEVGVDVERIRPMHDANGVMERFFTLHEREWIAGIPPHGREAAFFECWTRKESVLKALGTGLSLAPERIETRVDHDGTSRLMAISGAQEPAANWTLHPFLPDEGYRGCLAAPSGASPVSAIRLKSIRLFSEMECGR